MSLKAGCLLLLLAECGVSALPSAGGLLARIPTFETWHTQRRTAMPKSRPRLFAPSTMSKQKSESSIEESDSLPYTPSISREASSEFSESDLEDFSTDEETEMARATTKVHAEPASFVRNAAQIGLGASLIFATERAVWAAGRQTGCRTPSAPAGMMLVFFGLLVTHFISPEAAEGTCEFFEPALHFFNRWVPLFFSPSLVQLPLSLLGLSSSTILKCFFVVVSGSVVSIASSAAILDFFTSSFHSIEGESLPKMVPKAKNEKAVRTDRQLFMLLAGLTTAFAMLRLESISILCFSLAALEFGKLLPAAIRGFVPPMLTSAGTTALLLAYRGLKDQGDWKASLRAYKTGCGGLFGGIGIGDKIASLASPAVVALGFRMYQQRHIVQKHAGLIFSGSVMMAIMSTIYTLFSTRLLALPSRLSLSLFTRFISLPMGVPIASDLGADTGLAALFICIQGIVGANFGLQIMDAVGARCPIARGISIGGTSAALGTAGVASVEPTIAAPAAICFLMMGANMSVLAQLPIAKALMRSIFMTVKLRPTLRSV